MRHFSVSQGTFGPRLTLSGPWTSAAEVAATESGIAEIYLNYPLGWDAQSLAILRTFPRLEAVQLLAPNLEIIHPLQDLTELKSLKLEVAAGARLDLGVFPKLEEFSGFWRNVRETLWAAQGLRLLRLIGFSERVPSSFKALSRLRGLAMYTAAIQELGDVSDLTGLTALSLAHCRNLTTLEGIAALAQLKELTLKDCKLLNSLTAVQPLGTLASLIVDDCGAIESLKPLEGLAELRTVRFTGSTSIEDGNLAVLRQLPNLTNLGFKQRKHYNTSWRSFPPQLFESRYHLDWS